MKFIFKLFGWLFSNLLLIMVVLALCYTYVYWDDPFAAKTPAGRIMADVADEINEVKSFFGGLTSPAADSDGEDTTVIISKTQSSDTMPDSAAGDETLSSIETQATFAEDTTSVPIPELLAGDDFVTPEIEETLSQLNIEDSMQDATSMQQMDKAAIALMIDARKAFYKKDYDASVASYNALIAIDSDNFDALGELGNVFFTQGKMMQAADAYYRAATIMVSQGKTQRAASLIGFLASVDADKAKKLDAMLVQHDQNKGAL